MWLIMLVLTCIAVVYHTVILGALIDFEHDYVNPLDLCSQLSKKMDPVLIIEIAIGVLALGDLKRGWLILLIHVITIAVILQLKKRRIRMFDPLTIVRDIFKIKVRQSIFWVFDAISLVNVLVAMAWTYFGYNK